MTTGEAIEQMKKIIQFAKDFHWGTKNINALIMSHNALVEIEKVKEKDGKP